MRHAAAKVRDLALLYLKWAWPLLLADAALEPLTGRPDTAWRHFLNTAAFGWVVCAPVLPLSLLLSRERRERVMGKLCGLKEGDERERLVTGEAARATLLLALSLQTVLLALTLISVRISYDHSRPAGEKRGLLSVGMGFSSSRHLDPFGVGAEEAEMLELGAVKPVKSAASIAGGFLLAPSAFSVLALLILIQLAAFKFFATRRYEGLEA